MNYFVAELTVNVSGFIPGEFKDWPANIHDRIMLALEAHGKRMNRKYDVFKAWCDYDIDEGHYIRVVARSPMLVTLQ